MPQLDPSSYSSQLFWLLVSFFLLYFIVSKYILPSVSVVLQGRQERISNDLDKAEALKEEAERLRGEYMVMLEDARQKASAFVLEAVETSNANAEKVHAQQDKLLKERLETSEKNIAAARNKAMSKLSPIASELAKLVVKKVANIDVNSKQADAVVNKLLKDI